MHKKVLQNAHFKNRFALQTDGEIGQIDRFETCLLYTSDAADEL